MKVHITTNGIFKLLRDQYKLKEEFIIRLKMDIGSKTGIVICCTVNDIIKEHDCSEKDEKEISDLLATLLKKHFNAKTT